MGAICGSIVLFAINFNQNYRLSYAPPPMASYIVLASLEVLGAFCALFLVPFANVHREVMCIRSYDFLDARIEAYEMLYMFRDRWILVLIPLFLVSNFFYTYQWTLVNGAIFNLRTRAFNSIIYWTSQILAAFAISFLHDYKHLPRRWRGTISLVIVTMLTCIVWGCSLAYQLVHLDSPLTGRADAATDSLIDFTQFKRSGIPTTLFFSMGVVAALWQSLAYWLIGTMSEDSAMIARYAGFHKSIQSMGAMVAWQLEAQSVSFMVQIIVNWSLVVAALPPTLYFTLNIKNERQEKYPMNFIDIA
ncbi:hypothetical protein H4S02_001390 [Coemansia sp. RSA 2611]|nr:hypothetical protein H4S02_001390 [Coemansia sp. RSA 2611]